MEDISLRYVNDITFASDWKESWKEHFKSQIILFEARGTQARVLYNGGGHQTRHSLMIQAVSEAMRKNPLSSSKRFYLFTGDSLPYGVGLEWKLLSTVGKRADYERVIPDAHSFAWPEIGIKDFKIHNHEMIMRSNALTKKGEVINKTFWRGSLAQNSVRSNFKNHVENSPDFEVSDNEKSGFFDMRDVGMYSTLVDLPGQGFSGRLKHLLVSGRPVVVFPRESWDWVTLQLEPCVDMLVTMPSIEDLAERCNLLMKNSSIRNHYASVGQKALRYLDREVLLNAVSNCIKNCD